MDEVAIASKRTITPVFYGVSCYSFIVLKGYVVIRRVFL